MAGPTPLYFAKRLTETLGGAQIYLKREDLLHTGAHKINNCLGQALLARRMGKKRIIAETGAGQHGVATATVCALFGLECVVYMGEEDMRRQRLNVFRMRLLGAKVVGVTNGSRTLKDAISEAMRDWVTNVDHTHYLLGSALGAHPYPMMVRDFHRVIGDEARAQILEAKAACRIGCSPASAGAAMPSDCSMLLLRTRCEADRRGGGRPQQRAGRACGAVRGRRAGSAAGRVQLSAAGRRWAGRVDALGFGRTGLRVDRTGARMAARPERAEYRLGSDTEALAAAQQLARTEGIIPALESAHAVAEAIRRAPSAKGKMFIVNLSGAAIKTPTSTARISRSWMPQMTPHRQLFERLEAARTARA